MHLHAATRLHVPPATVSSLSLLLVGPDGGVRWAITPSLRVIETNQQQLADAPNRSRRSASGGGCDLRKPGAWTDNPRPNQLSHLDFLRRTEMDTIGRSHFPTPCMFLPGYGYFRDGLRLPGAGRTGQLLPSQINARLIFVFE